MSDTPKESQVPSIEQLAEGEITKILALHLMNIKFFHIPLIKAGNVTPEETFRTFEAQISRAAERIVQEVLIPELQPDAVGKRGKISLKPDVLRTVMLNHGKLQKVFEKVFKNVFADTFEDEFLKQSSVTYICLFDREMMIALAGGRPKDEVQEENAGARLDRIVDEFAKKTLSFQCPLGKKSPDQ